MSELPINLESIEAFAEAIVGAKRTRARTEQEFQDFARAVRYLLLAESVNDLNGIRDEINKGSIIWCAEYSKYAELLDIYYTLHLAILQQKVAAS